MKLPHCDVTRTHGGAKIGINKNTVHLASANVMATSGSDLYTAELRLYEVELLRTQAPRPCNNFHKATLDFGSYIILCFTLNLRTLYGNFKQHIIFPWQLTWKQFLPRYGTYPAVCIHQSALFPNGRHSHLHYILLNAHFCPHAYVWRHSGKMFIVKLQQCRFVLFWAPPLIVLKYS